MNIAQMVYEADRRTVEMARMIVVAVWDDGTVVVVGDKYGPAGLECDLLSGDKGSALRLVAGECVLVWRPSDENERPVVLGRVGPRRAPPVKATGVPAELVIEAGQTLTLKCGDGSITIQADGKILIKGKDLVSRAQRTNRIKGGAVSIN